MEIAEPTLWPDFEKDFWPAYDKKTGKIAALKEWNKLSQKDREAAMLGVWAYVASTPDKKYRLDPERYLKRKKWEDEIIGADKANGHQHQGSAVDQKKREVFEALARRRGGAGTHPYEGN